MHKIFNILFLTFFIFFSFSTYKYYTSNANLKSKQITRNNIDDIINNKILNIPILKNDTDNVIEFNNSLSKENYNNKPRSFWSLFKN
jgi:hypothetical protein